MPNAIALSLTFGCLGLVMHTLHAAIRPKHTNAMPSIYWGYIPLPRNRIGHNLMTLGASLFGTLGGVVGAVMGFTVAGDNTLLGAVGLLVGTAVGYAFGWADRSWIGRLPGCLGRMLFIVDGALSLIVFGLASVGLAYRADDPWIGLALIGAGALAYGAARLVDALIGAEAMLALLMLVLFAVVVAGLSVTRALNLMISLA